MPSSQRVNCIGLSLGESDYCVSVFVGNCPVYLHGTTDDVRAFAAEIIAAADSYDRTATRPQAEPVPVPEPIEWRGGEDAAF